MLTANVDPGFEKAFLNGCKAIGCAPRDLLAVMMSESRCSPAAHNPHGDASGLIQFMPDTLRGLGWTQGDQAFRMLSASAQMPYVVAYYRPWAKAAGKWDSIGRLYQATFLPGTLATSKNPEDVIAAKGGRLGWAYEANSVFDANGDKVITIQELTDATLRAAQSQWARWCELTNRLGIATKEEQSGMPFVHGITIHNVHDVQLALNALGYADPQLVADGIAGPKTAAAVREFQEAAGLHVDGIAGKATRAALAEACAQMGSPEEEDTGEDESKDTQTSEAPNADAGSLPE
jgi:hypothetical protein